MPWQDDVHAALCRASTFSDRRGDEGCLTAAHHIAALQRRRSYVLHQLAPILDIAPDIKCTFGSCSLNQAQGFASVHFTSMQPAAILLLLHTQVPSHLLDWTQEVVQRVVVP